MTYKVCYWDAEAKEQKERDATPDEVIEIEARKAAASAPVVPQSITRRQGLQQLRIEGFTEEQIIAKINELPITQLQKDLALIEFKESRDFERNRPLVGLMITMLGKDAAWGDQMFIEAFKL